MTVMRSVCSYKTHTNVAAMIRLLSTKTNSQSRNNLINATIMAGTEINTDVDVVDLIRVDAVCTADVVASGRIHSSPNGGMGSDERKG